METIDIFISKIDKDGLPRRCGMRSLVAIFNDLAEKLQNKGLISDLHFTFNKKQMNLSDVTTASFLCYCSYGRNGGIFLDIDLKTDKFNLNFATGKTSNDDYLSYIHMNRIAAECAVLLNNDGKDIKIGNRVYATPMSNTPLTLTELRYEFAFCNEEKAKMLTDVEMAERINGDLCNCCGEGEFDLLPLNNEDVMEDQKRYMKCRKCGCWSHL